MQTMGAVPLWRWLFFLAWSLPLFVMTRMAMFLCFLTLERRFLTSRRFLYYMIGIKVPALRLLALCVPAAGMRCTALRAVQLACHSCKASAAACQLQHTHPCGLPSAVSLQLAVLLLNT